MPVQDPEIRCDHGLVWEVGEPLLPAIRGDKNSLSHAGRHALNALMGRQPAVFVGQLLLTWCLIGVAIAAANYFQQVWLDALVVLFVATRQNVLALLLHEQVHRLAFRSRWGYLLCNWAIAYSLLITVEGYRRVHLAHHRHYFTEEDSGLRS